MIVDPATGMPLSNPNGTFGSERVMDALDSAGYTQENVPLVFDLLSAVPGAATTTAWNMGRVSNTIISGGAADRGVRPMVRRSVNSARSFAADTIDNATLGVNPRVRRVGQRFGSILTPSGGPGQGGFLSQGFRQTFNPLRVRRLTSAGNIDPAEGSKMYSPFGFVAAQGNQFIQGRGAAGFLTGRVGRSNAVRNYLNRRASFGQDIDWETDAFSRGTMGRITAMSRIGAMSDRRLNRRTPRIINSLGQMGVGVDASELGTGLMRRGQLMGSTASAVTGQISGRLSGYFAGAQAQRMGAEAVAGVMQNVTGVARLGAERGALSYAQNRTIARVMGSRGASMALRAAGPVGTALLVGDLARMAGMVMGEGINVIRDAGKSLTAPLNKGVMGNAFRDNPTAATARQRGVMAIANSRLNMRSVMGHEAAAMSAYFG